ncbi:MAG: nodulation protein NodH, partial [Pseudomonadota bacterium]
MTGRYFVIFGTMRTGSNLLESLLSQLPDVEMFGELFNPSFMMQPNCTDFLGWTLADRDADPIGFLERVRHSVPGRIVGFRLFDGHEARVADHVLADPECARIILRRDPVDSFLSLRIAQETDQWILRNPRRRKRARVRFDPQGYDRYVADVAAHYRELNEKMTAAGTTAATITYDQLTDLAEVNRLAAHIGSDARLADFAPEILRQNPEPREAKVSNAPEMLAHLGRAPAVVEAPAAANLIRFRAGPLAWSPMPAQDNRIGLGILAAL